MKKLLLNLTVAVPVALALATVSVSAYPTLFLDDPSTAGIDITVQDNGVLDSNPNAGVVTYIGGLTTWAVNVDIGITKPALGSAVEPRMDVTFNVMSAAAGTLVLQFADDGFTYSGGLVDDFGGTTDGTVVDNVYVNDCVVATIGPLGPGAYSGSAGATVNLTPQDVLTLEIIINHGDGMLISSGDKYVGIPDGGATLVLLGCSLLGLGLISRRVS